jgi:hypothetical protein
MPQRIIQAIEYECYRCGYTWISRIEKEKPRHCSKCKHPEWAYPRMTREEKYLRNRVRIADGTYKTGMLRNRYIENTPTCHKFLYCDPRPTEEELLRVLNAFDYDDYYHYDILETDYEKIRESKKKEGEKVMVEIIKSRKEGEKK